MAAALDQGKHWLIRSGRDCNRILIRKALV